MMDELELLKQDWQKKEQSMPRLSFEELHTMIWKKSSSIVKWIFIISVLEFTLPHLLYLNPNFRNVADPFESIGLKYVGLGITVVGYAVMVYFIVQFYRRYKEISVLDNSKKLMEKIIRTRKTVKNYIIFSLFMALLIFAIMAAGVHFTSDISTLYNLNDHGDVTMEEYRKLMFWGFIITGILFTAILGGFYFLIYGILLRKLNANFKELQNHTD